MKYEGPELAALPKQVYHFQLQGSKGSNRRDAMPVGWSPV